MKKGLNKKDFSIEDVHGLEVLRFERESYGRGYGALRKRCDAGRRLCLREPRQVVLRQLSFGMRKSVSEGKAWSAPSPT